MLMADCCVKMSCRLQPILREKNMKLLRLSLFLLLSILRTFAVAQPLPPVSTFSIVAIDPQNGDLGVAVASRYFSVGSVVPWGMAEAGAVATQANVNVGYGQQAIDLLRQGMSAQDALKKLLADDKFPGKDGRQVAIVDAKGNIAAYTGPNAPKWAGDRQGKTWSAQGNILVGAQVPEAMGKAFDATQGELAEKLFAALKAGDFAGGDSRGRQSASILVVRKGGGRNTNNDRYVYINVDDHPEPLRELRRLLDIQMTGNHQTLMNRALTENRFDDALKSAEHLARYAPLNAQSHMILGFTAYLAGKPEQAFAAFKRAHELTLPNQFKQLWDNLSNRAAYKKVLEDKVFVSRVAGS